LTRITRRLFYSLAISHRLEGLVRGARLLEGMAYRAARRYVAGSSLEDALVAVRRLHGQGFAVSLDLFGEGVTDRQAVEQTVGGYLEAAQAIQGLGADVHLEVVPSHLGIDDSVDFCRRQAERIAEALPAGSRLQVSAEENWRTEPIMGVILAMGAGGAPLTATLQANLKRTPRDADRLAEAGVPVRLVKGAYVEPADVAHPWGEQTDLAFVRLAHQLNEADAALSIGTHDPVIREALLLALPGLRVEMLLGVRPEDAQDLIRRGHHVRIYVPYGQDWFRYWMRRVAESRGSH
jgi:proline dehydrogenase